MNGCYRLQGPQSLGTPSGVRAAAPFAQLCPPTASRTLPSPTPPPAPALSLALRRRSVSTATFSPRPHRGLQGKLHGDSGPDSPFRLNSAHDTAPPTAAFPQEEAAAPPSAASPDPDHRDPVLLFRSALLLPECQHDCAVRDREKSCDGHKRLSLT